MFAAANRGSGSCQPRRPRLPSPSRLLQLAASGKPRLSTSLPCQPLRGSKARCHPEPDTLPGPPCWRRLGRARPTRRRASHLQLATPRLQDWRQPSPSAATARLRPRKRRVVTQGRSRLLLRFACASQLLPPPGASKVPGGTRGSRRRRQAVYCRLLGAAASAWWYSGQ